VEIAAIFVILVKLLYNIRIFGMLVKYNFTVPHLRYTKWKL